MEASWANTEPKQSKEDKTEKVRGIVMNVFLPLLTAICSLFMLMAYCRSYPAAPFALILSDSILLNTHLAVRVNQPSRVDTCHEPCRDMPMPAMREKGRMCFDETFRKTISPGSKVTPLWVRVGSDFGKLGEAWRKCGCLPAFLRSWLALSVRKHHLSHNEMPE